MEVLFNGIGTNGNYERPVHLTYCFYPKRRQQLWGFSIRWSVSGEVGYWPLSDETVPLDLATDLPTGVECWYHTIGEEEIMGMVMTGSKNLERLALVTHWENVYGDPTIGKTTRFYPFTGPWYGFEYVWQKDTDFPDGRSVDLRPIVTHCPCEIDKLYLSQKHNDTANFTLDVDEGVTKSAKLFFAINAVVELFFKSRFLCENDHIYVYGLTSIEPTPFTSTFFKVDDSKRKYYLQTIDPRDYLAGPYYEVVMQANMTADDLFMNN